MDKQGKRPAGLTILAVINIIFGAVSLLGLVMVAAYSREPVGTSNYLTLFAAAALFLSSGIGILRLSPLLGYRTGCLVWLAPLIRLIAHWITVIQYRADFSLYHNLIARIPPFIYPVILFLFLRYRYRGYFFKDKG